MLGYTSIAVSVTVASWHDTDSVMASQEWGILSYYHTEAKNIKGYSLAIHMYVQSLLSIHNSIIESPKGLKNSLLRPDYHCP